MTLRNEAASPANSEEQACLVAEKFLPAVGMFTALPERSNPPDYPQFSNDATVKDFVPNHARRKRDEIPCHLWSCVFSGMTGGVSYFWDSRVNGLIP